MPSKKFYRKTATAALIIWVLTLTFALGMVTGAYIIMKPTEEVTEEAEDTWYHLSLTYQVKD